MANSKNGENQKDSTAKVCGKCDYKIFGFRLGNEDVSVIGANKWNIIRK